jgi:hypothetical protein
VYERLFLSDLSLCACGVGGPILFDVTVVELQRTQKRHIEVAELVQGNNPSDEESIDAHHYRHLC